MSSSSAWAAGALLTGDSGGNQLGEERVETTHRPIALTAQVDVALGEEAQHLAVVRCLHRCESRRAQRGDCDRAGVVGVVLVRLPGAEETHSRCERRRHVDDDLACIDELLGEEVAETAC